MKTYFVLLFLSLIAFSLASISHRTGSKSDPFKLQSEEADFESIHERQLRSPTSHFFKLNDTNNVARIYYSGTDSRVIFIVTYRTSGQTVISSHLYRSTDYGSTFTRIDSLLESTGTVRLFPFIHFSPSDNTHLMIPHESQAKIYYSNDEGVTFYSRTFSPNTIDPRSLTYHPTHWDWFMAHDPTNLKLYVSRNLGQTFTLLSNNVNSTHEYQWGTAPYDTDETMVYYNTDDPNDLTSEVNLYTQKYPYTTSTRAIFDPNFGVHDDFLMVDRYIFAQKTINSVANLYVSYDRHPFQLAHIPTNLAHKNYVVDSIKARQALVYVQHTNNQLNLYLSDETGAYFSLSLPDVVYGGGGIDVELIDSMNGTTYISNQNVYTSSSSSTPSQRTLISYDAGGNWEMLRPPTTDVNGNLLECILPTCSLHLHMSNTAYWRTGIYSTSSAPGIIIAHGITGSVLNNDNVNLFISRDGGVTWNMTLSSTWGVSVLDYGGLIVAARDYHQGANSIQSQYLRYSCDEGRSWTQYHFATANTIVWGVITEPGQATTVASLYGTQSSSNGWVIYKIDFQNVFTSACSSSDYYTWTPYDAKSDTGCLLGATVAIERRRPFHCCLSGSSYNREISFSICQCYEEDFECDYGYKHANGITGPCIRDSTVVLPDPCSGTGLQNYMKSQGYRKIGGDVCSGGVESQYMKVQTPCCLSGNSSSGPTSSSGGSTATPGPTSSSGGSTPSAPVGTPGAVTSGTSDKGIAIVLGVVLIIALLIIFVMFAVIVVVVLKMYMSGRRSGQYSRVPVSSSSNDNERLSFGNVQEKDDDDDDGPLPL